MTTTTPSNSANFNLTYGELKSIQRIDVADSCMPLTYLFEFFPENNDQKANNFIYRSDCPNREVLIVVLSACFAYTLIKCSILVMMMIYQASSRKGISEKLNRMEEEFPILSGSSENERTARLIKEQKDEIEFYGFNMNLTVIFEICMGLRDCLLFHGLGYFVSYLQEIVFVYYKPNEAASDETPISFSQCVGGDEQFSSSTPLTLNNVRFYLMTLDVCSNRFPYYGLLNQESSTDIDYQKAMMYFSIIVWILLESLSNSVLVLNAQVLCQTNEAGNKPMKQNEKFRKTSYAFFFLQVAVMLLLDIGCNMRLHYRFQSGQTIMFFLFWKCLTFMLIFDQYNKKNSLSNPTKIEQDFDQLIEKLSSDMQEDYLRNEIQPQPQYSDHLIDSYNTQLQDLYDEIKLDCNIIEKEKKGRTEFYWQGYIRFNLIALTFGISGLFICLIHFSINIGDAIQNPESSGISDGEQIIVNDLNGSSTQIKVGKYLQSDWLYWLGFILCLCEAILIELFNTMSLIRGYYFPLMKKLTEQIQSIQNSKKSHED